MPPAARLSSPRWTKQPVCQSATPMASIRKPTAARMALYDMRSVLTWSRIGRPVLLDRRVLYAAMLSPEGEEAPCPCASNPGSAARTPFTGWVSPLQ